MKKSSAYIWGLLLITLGVLFTIHNFTDLSVWKWVWNFWPLILIVLGVQKIVDYFAYEESEE